MLNCCLWPTQIWPQHHSAARHRRRRLALRVVVGAEAAYLLAAVDELAEPEPLVPGGRGGAAGSPRKGPRP